MLLISDANLIIDMEEGGLLGEIFALEEVFAVPDVLFVEELSTYYLQLIDLGLQLKVLDGESVMSVMQMSQKYRGPSMNDLFALELARKCKCPLLTGDRLLRSATEEERVELRGTLWLVEELVRRGVITVTTATIAYQKMRDAGSRLPWEDADLRLRQLIQPL